MQQLQNVWGALDSRKKIIVVLSAIAVLVAILTMSRMAAKPSLTLLYSGLESGPAGEVVQSLEQRGVVYEVRGGAIFVESGKRDELRMTLASEGLPTNNAKGYELLDSLTGFGTTSQMFDAAYWRAKEGELARTIVSSPQIAAARVHIANAGANPFQRNLRPSASISVTTVSGTLAGTHAKALKYLVASAVTGLDPRDVSVIDGKGGLISTGEEGTGAKTSDDKADILRDRVQNLLEARVGYGNAVVEVSVDTVTERESIRETRIDPESRVAISTDTEERSDNSTESAGGDVTVASNIPDGEAGGGGDNSSQNSQTRERINYEVSETHREILRTPGAIKRISVAVLVNGTQTTGEDGLTSFTPRPDDELSALRELVASAVGFDDGRGDVITIKSMEFQPIEAPGSGVDQPLMSRLNLDLMSIIQLAVLALVTLVLGLFVLRPLLSKQQEANDLPVLAPPLGGGLAAGTTDGPGFTMGDTGDLSDMPLPEPLTGEISNGPIPMGSRPMDGDFGGPIALGGEMGPSSEDPVERLRNLIGERQEETVEILRSWLEDREESV
ncbi:MAG: flagellar M-ring protein FliF [Rhodobacterales bacterium]|nr:MAG: flagellar M-ring protein FliF [Rhodobacterales bacterium]